MTNKPAYGDAGEHSMGLQKKFKEDGLTKNILEAAKPHQTFELGNGLEVWLVDIALLKEQSVNARAMASDAFLQLTHNIGNRGALESLPLCAATDKGIEIISGHHRVRAARKAELTQIWVLVDVSGITGDQLRAKQLAHNSLQGEDNQDLVRQIFDSIEDIEARIEAFVQPDLSGLDNEFSLNQKDFLVEFETKVCVLLFLPVQHSIFQKAIADLEAMGEIDSVYLAQREEYETMVALLGEASEHYEIKSTPTLFAKMAEIVRAHMEAETPDGEHLED